MKKAISWEALDWENTPSGLPIFKRVAEAIIALIEDGSLRPGDQLPSSRALADSLSIHRNTILAAYDELMSQGFLLTERGRGTYVSEELSLKDRKTRAREPNAKKVSLRLASAPRLYSSGYTQQTPLPLLGGLPDLKSVPTELLARAYRTALRNSRGKTLDYGSELGHPRFISALSTYLRETRGVDVAEGEMMVTRGSQQALHLAARALNRPGSVFAVERAGYPPAWEAFKLAGCELAPVGIDGEGLIVSELAQLCRRREVAAVYVTPHHQYPTTATLSAKRRMELLALSEQAQFVIIEDDYDHEFHFDARPVLPLKTRDRGGTVLHVGTLSKVMAPGLRVGYAVGQRPLIELMAQVRLYIDRQGDTTLELALAYLIEDGELGAHVRRMHRSYRQRRLALFEALDRYLGEELSYERPAGGLAVWAQVAQGHSAGKWAQRAHEFGVVVQPAQLFFMDGKDHPFLRLGYARLAETEIFEAVKRFARARRLKKDESFEKDLHSGQDQRFGKDQRSARALRKSS